jgi:predicted nucleic acid-binding protein
MQRVVDASVVAKWFLPEIHKDKAEKLLKDYIGERIDLAAPDLLLAEFSNLIWKRANKIKDITAGQADQILEDFLALRVPLRDTAGFAATALKHATQRDHPIYDMLYIILAEQDSCEFITADQTLVRKFGHVYPCLRWIGDL